MDTANGLGHILTIAFESHDKTAIKAAWVLDIIARQNHVLFLPHLPTFCKQIHQIKNDSAKRPFAKIAAILSLEARKGTTIVFTPKQEEQLVAIHFDWLTSNTAIAVKVYSMETLYQLGFSNSWVHPALKTILIQELSSESPAYRAHGKKLLNNLNTAL
ncbi:MAG: hypothetical protein COB98_07290 [Flavobacteriaceae bacterium]|nr:MAG: hypothetical protein COB98_07290 [Flavobacteriaceae bacterium]